MKKAGNFARRFLYGTVAGCLNGLFGAGGGVVLVPLLIKEGFERKKAHKNAVAIILPITFLSATLYILRGNVAPADALKYVPGGLIGAIVGSFLINKLPVKVIRRIFALFMIWAGWRLVF